MSKRVLAVVIVALAAAPSAFAGGPTMTIGATEDIVKQPDRVAARRRAGDPLGDEPRQPDDAALRPGPVRLRHVRGERRARAPLRARLRDRERAEPEPVLAAAIRPGRKRRGRARV